jgi:hydroxypyruvate reductase
VTPADPRRALLLDLFRTGLAAVDGRRRMRAALAGKPIVGPVSVFAAGKAAASMTLGVIDALGAAVARGLVVAPDAAIPAELQARPGLRCLEAGHPRPDERTLAAGEALLEFASGTAPGGLVLLLVSGGASALVEVPAPGVDLAELRAVFERSLDERLDIAELNRERCALSRIKGGQLPGLFAGARLEAFMISDVPHDDPAVLASGLLDAPGLRPRLVGSLDDALEAIARAAAAQGLRSLRGTARLAGDAEAAARRVCHELAVADADLVVHGGETTVRPAGAAGSGRALPAFRRRRGACDCRPFRLCTARRGHDGRDGDSEDAGAIVDGETVTRAADAGIEIGEALRSADSGPLLEPRRPPAYGTDGTNVGDVVLALRSGISAPM